MLQNSHTIIAGVDEAGCGPLAGPVVAAAVILHRQKPIAGLDDSKKLNENKRLELFALIVKHAVAYSVARADVEEIDRLNILRARLLAMERAVQQLAVKPHKVLVDGKICPKISYPVEGIIRGDSTVPAISAASILAKTVRDQAMVEYEEHYPGYGFAAHKGYATAAHRSAIFCLGVTPIHRKSFKFIRQSSLFPPE